jgi:hypothetical protein
MPMRYRAAALRRALSRHRVSLIAIVLLSAIWLALALYLQYLR